MCSVSTLMISYELLMLLTSCVLLSQVLDEMKVQKEMNREILVNVARTSLRTKVYSELADMLAEVSTVPCHHCCTYRTIGDISELRNTLLH